MPVPTVLHSDLNLRRFSALRRENDGDKRLQRGPLVRAYVHRSPLWQCCDELISPGHRLVLYERARWRHGHDHARHCGGSERCGIRVAHAINETRYDMLGTELTLGEPGNDAEEDAEDDVQKARRECDPHRFISLAEAA